VSSYASGTIVGGDIAGLNGLAYRLTLYPPQMQGVIDALDGRVVRLVNDAGWWGDAAQSFKARWEGDSTSAEFLQKVVLTVASIVGGLAADLQKVENELVQAADEARAAGVPMTDAGDLLDLPANASPEVAQAAMVYADTRQYALQVAEQARLHATSELQSVESVIGPPQQAGAAKGMPADSWVTVSDLVANLYALPASASRELRGRIPQLQAERNAALDRWRAARDQARLNGTKIPDDIKADHKATLRALNDANAELDSLERSDSRLSKLFDVRLGTLLRLSEVADGARAMKLFADVPVVDVVAGGLSTGIASYQDMQKGDDWTAIPKEASAQVVGIAAGAAVGAAVVGGAVLLGVAAPEIVVVGAAVVIGGVVAVGVGDMVSNAWSEHWDEDIHQHGVVGGIAQGVFDVDQRTVKDFENIGGAAKDFVASKASDIWHGIFG
jgi:hypothetical protein